MQGVPLAMLHGPEQAPCGWQGSCAPARGPEGRPKTWSPGAAPSQAPATLLVSELQRACERGGERKPPKRMAHETTRDTAEHSHLLSSSSSLPGAFISTGLTILRRTDLCPHFTDEETEVHGGGEAAST